MNKAPKNKKNVVQKKPPLQVWAKDFVKKYRPALKELAKK